jgi:hypothetical protein
MAELDGRGGGVRIDPDDLRTYHPRYAEHAARDHQTAAETVHDDASKMSKELRSDAIHERRNLIIDGTLSDPDRAEQLCRQLRDSGYEVDVCALAVNERVSQRGVAERLEASLADPAHRTIPRDVPEAVQSDAYQGMPNAVARIENACLADRVAVYKRYSVDPVYENSGGVPVAGNDAKSHIISERSREMTSAERVEHATVWDDLVEKAEKREALPAVHQRYAEACNAAHTELHRDPVASEYYDTPRSEDKLELSGEGIER